MIGTVIALGVATLPQAIFGGGVTGVQARMAVRSAQSRFVSLHDLSRALAVELGVPVRLVADPGTQTVTLQEGCTGEGRILESRDFNLSYRVELLTGGAALSVCMTPRGYADPGSNSFGDEATVTFLRGAHSASVVLFSLGQAVRS